jgi:hypothetical protein
MRAEYCTGADAARTIAVPRSLAVLTPTEHHPVPIGPAARQLRRWLAAAPLAALAAAPLGAQQDSTGRTAARKDAGPEADTLTLEPTRTVRFTTDEGTWMSLDVSPDGRTIVFDLLGDLYTLPIGGGRAKRITEGMGFDGQPRFSPDGKLVVFVSDRSGSENLWVVAPDGTRPRQVTRGDNAQYVSPEWTPGRQLHRRVALGERDPGQQVRPHARAPRGRGGGEAHRQGDGGRAAGAAHAAHPAAARQLPRRGLRPRRALHLRRRAARAVRLQPHAQERRELAGRRVRPRDREDVPAHGRGGQRDAAGREPRRQVPRVRHAARHRDRAADRDLASGDERWLAPAIQRDDMESRYTRDLLPGYAFTPDAKAVVLSYGGRFWRLDVASGKATAIPFTADVEQRMGPLVRSTYEINDSTLTVNQIRNARPSPDGRRLAFTALDKLWVMDLPRGTPRRLTTSRVGEHSPAWSPDGRHVAYVTWTEEGGDVYRVRSDGRGAPERLTRQSAFYEQLNYTPDGRRLVVARGPRQQRVERENEFEGPGPQVVELVWLPAAGGAARTITPLSFYGRPHFTRDTSRVFIYDPADGLVSMRFDGTDRKALVKVTGYTMPGADPEEEPPTPADEVIVSPDGARAIAAVNNKVYIVAVPMTGGRTPTVSVQDPAAAPVPIRRATRIGGDFLGWRDSTRFYYSLGHSFFTYDVARADSLVRDSTSRADSLKRAGGDTAAGAARADTARRRAGRADTARAGRPADEQVALAPADSARVARGDTAEPAKPAYEPDRIDVLITVPRDRPRGTVVLRNARVITMRGDEVIERGDVVVTNNRIAAVGAAGTVAVPAGARSIDVTGKTILPGWVDIHAHMWPTWGVHRTQVYEYLANLAYGVTTTRDPQTSTTDVLSYGDLVETARCSAPACSPPAPASSGATRSRASRTRATCSAATPTSTTRARSSSTSPATARCVSGW